MPLAEEDLAVPCSGKHKAKGHCEVGKCLTRPEEATIPSGLGETSFRMGLENCKVHVRLDAQDTEKGLNEGTGLGVKGGILSSIVEGKADLEGNYVEGNEGGASTSVESRAQIHWEEHKKEVGLEDCSLVANSGDASRQLGAEDCHVQPGLEECSTSGYDTDEYVTDHQVKTPAAYIQLLQHNHRTRRLFLSRRTPQRARKRPCDSDSMEVEPSDAVSSDVDSGMLEQVSNLDLAKQAGSSSVTTGDAYEPTGGREELNTSVEAVEAADDKLGKGRVQV